MFCHCDLMDVCGASVAEPVRSQRLTTDELGPPANLGGNTLLAGELLVHALSEENGGLDT